MHYKIYVLACTKTNGYHMMKNLLDVDDLAKYLKLQKQTIYNWLNQRKISGIKIGGVWRFDKREIDKWLKSQSRKISKRK
ncbi:MAG: helix-turn-helix domain-containing protein [Candidatus Zapsychrus exili]|nr:helix-turn-helix domain-containing protein [Candidatus Zapsychrus exili]